MKKSACMFCLLLALGPIAMASDMSDDEFVAKIDSALQEIPEMFRYNEKG